MERAQVSSRRRTLALLSAAALAVAVAIRLRGSGTGSFAEPEPDGGPSASTQQDPSAVRLAAGSGPNPPMSTTTATPVAAYTSAEWRARLGIGVPTVRIEGLRTRPGGELQPPLRVPYDPEGASFVCRVSRIVQQQDLTLPAPRVVLEVGAADLDHPKPDVELREVEVHADPLGDWDPTHCSTQVFRHVFRFTFTERPVLSQPASLRVSVDGQEVLRRTLVIEPEISGILRLDMRSEQDGRAEFRLRVNRLDARSASAAAWNTEGTAIPLHSFQLSVDSENLDPLHLPEAALEDVDLIVRVGHSVEERLARIALAFDRRSGPQLTVRAPSDADHADR